MLLYLHIPFCDSKCHYCAFNSYVDRFELREAYMKAAHRQLRHELEACNVGRGEIATVFIGGGTPSTVDAALYEPFFDTLAPYLDQNAEVTAEANPNSATKEWLAGMKGLGVGRVSFGVQSFFDDKLKLLGRAHRAKEAVDAVERAAAMGFSRLSLDLIYATMLDTPERVEKEVARALALPVEHLSAYELTIEEGTPFQTRPEVRKESVEQARVIETMTVDKGWRHYEISNFGRTPCRHNLGYWEYRPYLGIGSGAVGRVETKRYYPHRLPERYIEEPLHKEVEELDEEAMLQERLFLGLRSEVGVETFLLDDAMRRRCDLLVAEGKLLIEKGRYRNPDFLLADEIALFILG
ncbi:radical SAM family heme chaperone HemW [Hydrogenimonas sp.]